MFEGSLIHVLYLFTLASFTGIENHVYFMLMWVFSRPFHFADRKAKANRLRATDINSILVLAVLASIRANISNQLTRLTTSRVYKIQLKLTGCCTLEYAYIKSL